MRKLAVVLGLVAAFSLSAFSQMIPWNELKELRKEVSNKHKVSSKYSKGSEITWFKSRGKNAGVGKDFMFYFGFSDDGTLTPLRLKFTYSSSSWLFIDKIRIFTGSRKKGTLKVYEFNIDRSDISRDVQSGGTIKEIIDMSLPDGLVEVLDRIVLSEKNIFVSIELHGDKYTTGGCWASSYKSSYKEARDARQLIVNKRSKSIF